MSEACSPTDGYLVISIPNAGPRSSAGRADQRPIHLPGHRAAGLHPSCGSSPWPVSGSCWSGPGSVITRIERTRRTAEQTSLAIHDVALPAELRDRMLEASPEAQTYQFIVRAEPADAAGAIADLRERLAHRRGAARRAGSGLRSVTRTPNWPIARELPRPGSPTSRPTLPECDGTGQSWSSGSPSWSRRLAREQRITATERKRYEQALAEAKRGFYRCAGAGAAQDQTAGEGTCRRLQVPYLEGGPGRLVGFSRARRAGQTVEAGTADDCRRTGTIHTTRSSSG